MSPVAEIGLIAARELRTSTRSVKGIILGLLTLLGSALAIFICIWIESTARDKLGADSTEAFAQLQEQMYIKGGTDPGLAAYLAHTPLSLMVFLKVMVWVGPLLVALLGFDSVSGDLQHRGVRFWTVRTRRWSYLLGKFFGLWGTVSRITLALVVLSGGAVLIRGYISFSQFFSWGLRFWLVSALIVGTWSAIAIFVSTRFKTPLLALLSTFGVFFAIWFTGVVGLVSRLFDAAKPGDEEHARMVSVHWYEYLNPNGYDDLLLSPKPSMVAAGLGACAVYMIVFVGLSALLFAKKDV